VAREEGPQKPRHIGGYTEAHTLACQRALLTLIAHLGPWRQCIFLAGGMAPLYLVDAQEGSSRAYVPTMDIDLVIDVEDIHLIEAYSTLEQNLKRLRFERDVNSRGQSVHYRWNRVIDDRTTVTIDFLCAATGRPGSAIAMTKGLSALSIPGAHLIKQDHVPVKIHGELLDEMGISSETVNVTGVVTFVILKAYAYDERREEKDAHDLIYILRGYTGGPAVVGQRFRDRLIELPAEPMVAGALALIQVHFGSDAEAGGFRKNGCVSFARFHLSPGQAGDEVRMRREAAAIVDVFLTATGWSAG
jgi:hypothetical protein